MDLQRNDRRLDEQPLVVLLSDSVLMEGLGNSLRNDQGMNVLQMNACSSCLLERVNTLKPDLVVIDLGDPQPSVILSLLRKQPDTLFLGIDPQFSQVMIFNCHRTPVRSMQEFCKIAQRLVDRQRYPQREG